MAEILCRAEKKLFPPEKADDIGFMVVAYKALNISDLPEQATALTFTANGALLPCSPSSTITLFGEWKQRNGAYELCCTHYSEKIHDTPQGITDFLCTLDACDLASASRIQNACGSIKSLEANPALILGAVHNQRVAQQIVNNFRLRTTQRACLVYLLEHKVDRQHAIDTALKAGSLNDIQTNPFRFSVDGLLPYASANKIAQECGCDRASPEGMKAAILDTLRQVEGQSSTFNATEGTTSGSTFCDIGELLLRTANTVGILRSDARLKDALYALIDQGKCTCAQGSHIYRKETSDAEYGIASHLLRLMNPTAIPIKDYVKDIYGLENKKNMRLAPEQRAAVKKVLNNAVTLLVGGPGTGKTSIEKFIIEVFRMHHPQEQVLLMAPTGKAARRMSESTGEMAVTIHKALGVTADEEVINSDTVFEAGMVLVDEASMLDEQVAFALLKAIKTGTQLVLIGDPDQLPSVGAGNVLAELIQCGVVPLARLETVYRQKAGSLIATNCARIKRSCTSLEYEAGSFEFIEVTTPDEAVQTILNTYHAELVRGISTEQICVLSPFKKKTETGINQLNPKLQTLVQGASTKPSLLYGATKTFIEGDKVMCLANRDDVANGDMGYITHIDKANFTVDYGDGRILPYSKSDMRDFELAYGITIHKSQGSEYATCIIIMMPEHQTMLKRNLLYTAVSRAKQKVVVIGTVEALNTAIMTADASMRQSRLGELLVLMNKNSKKNTASPN